MPKLATIESRVGIPRINTGGPYANFDASAIGEGVARMGAGIASAAVRLQGEWEQAETYKTEAAYQEWRFEEAKRFDEISRNLPPAEAQGFADNYAAGYRNRASAFFNEQVPGRLKPYYNSKLFEFERSLYADSLDIEREHVANVFIDSLGSATRSAQLELKEIAEGPIDDATKNPKRLEKLNELYAMIDAAPIDEAKKAELKDAVEKSIDDAFWDSLPPNERILSDPGNEYQGWADVISQRAGEEVTESDVESHIEWLKGRGFEPTAANVYMSHIFGREGAALILAAEDENAPAHRILPKQAPEHASLFFVDHDPKQALTVRELKEAVAGEVQGAIPVRWADVLSVDFDDIMSGVESAKTDILALQAAQKKAQQEQYEAQYEELRRKVQMGQVSFADLERLNEAGFFVGNQNDYTTLYGEVDKYNGDTLTAAKTAELMAGDHQFHASVDSDEQKGLDLLAERGYGHVDLLGEDEESVIARQQLRSFFQRTREGGDIGYIPKVWREQLRAGAWSNDVAERDHALGLMEELQANGLRAYMDAFDSATRHRVDVHELTKQLAPERRNEWLDPDLDFEKMEPALKEGRDRAVDVEDSVITSYFEAMTHGWATSFFTSAPNMPIDPVMYGDLRSDFDRLYANAFAISRDESKSQAFALKALTRKWGISNIGSSSYLMPYRPEDNLPMVDASHDWANEQLESFVKDNAPEAESWQVTATPETDHAVSHNQSLIAIPKEQRPPRLPVPYGVIVVGEDGIPRPLLDDENQPGVIVFDYDEANEANRADFTDERNSDEPFDPVRDIMDSVLPDWWKDRFWAPGS